MKIVWLVVVLALFCLSGCSTPGSEYARAHPELSPAHRQIIINGKIPGGLAVEGMTKDQVRLAVGNPATVEKFNTGEAWLYVHKTFLDTYAGIGDDSTWGSGSKIGSVSKKSGNMGARQVIKKTTVLFQGDRATQAQITEERR